MSNQMLMFVYVEAPVDILMVKTAVDVWWFFKAADDVEAAETELTISHQLLMLMMWGQLMMLLISMQLKMLIISKSLMMFRQLMM